MKNLKYYLVKYENSKTQTGRDSAKINAEHNLSPTDFKLFLDWEVKQPIKPKRLR